MSLAAPRILLVDDHPLFLDGLKATAAAAVDGAEIVACADTNAAEELLAQSDYALVTLDITMPGPCPFALAGRTSKVGKTKVVFLSGFFNEATIQRAASVGASGFISKHDDRAEVQRCLAAALRGERAVSRGIAKRFPVEALLSEVRSGGKPRLSARELEILSYVARGDSTKEIAELTKLKVRTVDRHRSNIMDKTGLHDRVKLTQFAIKEGYCQV